jgi:hypothetical protein
MGHVFTIIAPGAMGSAVARRMTERGATVRTSLAGRSAASIRRAAEAGMSAVETDRDLVEGVDIVLSIVPPGEAVGLAERLVPPLAATPRKPLVIDCNAINPGPRFYLSGPAAGGAAVLREYGVDIRLLDGAVGAASALKMSYAGITKGLTALGSAMMLGAAASGSAAALLKELGDSQPNLLAYFRRSVPDMYGKAHRWIAEMDEIASFLGEGSASGRIYQGMAQFYDSIAIAAAADCVPGNPVATLEAVLAAGAI